MNIMKKSLYIGLAVLALQSNIMAQSFDAIGQVFSSRIIQMCGHTSTPLLQDYYLTGESDVGFWDPGFFVSYNYIYDLGEVEVKIVKGEGSALSAAQTFVPTVASSVCY